MNALRIISSEVAQEYTDLFRTIVRVDCCKEGEKKFQVFFEYKKDGVPTRVGEEIGIMDSQRGYLPNMGLISKVVNETVQQYSLSGSDNIVSITDNKRKPDGRAGETHHDWD